VKDYTRDYATAAFRFYALNNMTAEEYKQKIYNLALEEYKQKQKGSGISCPTEAAVIRAEQAVDEKLAEIADIEAVQKTLDELRVRHEYDIINAISIVYFKDPKEDFNRGDIQSRVHQAELNIPASERQIYRWLRKARKLFALNRGLRIL